MAQSSDSADLIAFLQGLPEGRKRPGVRDPQWLLLLMAILGILRGWPSARDLERFAKRHHQAFSAALDLEMSKALCDSAFLYLPRAGTVRFAKVAQLVGYPEDAAVIRTFARQYAPPHQRSVDNIPEITEGNLE